MVTLCDVASTVVIMGLVVPVAFNDSAFTVTLYVPASASVTFRVTSSSAPAVRVIVALSSSAMSALSMLSTESV
ncbi:MAG: hypothetical protein C5S52_08555 [ANME-2 cluster archaeon]|nr:hypothetical protein [ANME-2 cluster archaeon]